MARDWNRRDVVRTGLAAGFGTLGAVSEAGANGEVTTTAGRGESLPSHGSRANRRQGARPVAVSSSNGLEAVKLAVDQVNAGVDTLDAVIAGVNIVERDPNDTSVGFGGLPNEEGVVQLDSSCMHGPSRRSGAVAAIEGVKTPSNIAQLVAYRTDHVLLVGEGASRFANAHGYGPENLLTERAREIWLRWKENVSDTDDWLAPEQEHEVAGAGFEPFVRDYGTINCNIVDADGNISGVTTTSGLSFKIPGRVGDSPIIGAGLYVDNDIGACGSTGRGEANLVDCCSFLVVELMRQGYHPKDAAIAALERVAHKTVAPRLVRRLGQPNFNLRFYCLNKAGEYAGASMYGEVNGRTATFAVSEGGESRHEDCVALFDSLS